MQHAFESWHFFGSRNWEAQALGNPAILLKTTLLKLPKSLKNSSNGSRNASVNRLSKRCQFRAPANVTMVTIAVTHYFQARLQQAGSDAEYSTGPTELPCF